jgi:predicted glycoside hydrolase/deacetylase ChbG (UPF0249 family)
MKKLIVTADDYGFTKSVNEGIIRAATQGIVTDIAVMVLTDQEDLDHGLKLLNKHHLTEVGLHTSLFPWSKTNRPRRQDFIEFFKSATDKEIEHKALDELKVFEKIFGYKPRFIAPQFNMHGNLRLLKVLAEYSTSHGIPMRVPWSILTQDEIEDNNYAAKVYLRRLGVKMPTHLYAHILGSNLSKITDSFISNLKQVKDGESCEILLHPGYFDLDILKGSSLNYERTRDLKLSMDQAFQQTILSQGFSFSHFRDL